MSAIPLSRTVHYPESDGRPMAETQAHGQVMIDLIHALGRRYAEVPDIYVWGNMLLYYVEGDPRACLAPDLFLVKGVDKHVRRTYKLWEEGRVPSLAIEVTSRSTRAEDTKLKKGIYERLGVDEYFLFDPFGEYLEPRLQGYRLADGHYRALPPSIGGSLSSQTTGLDLVPEGPRLRLRDSVSGELLPWADEEAHRADEEAHRADEEAHRADQEKLAREAAEERLRSLERELARLRGESPGR
jgi:Uma2 family endonuclease